MKFLNIDFTNKTVKAIEEYDFSEYGNLAYLVKRGVIRIAEHVTRHETAMMMAEYAEDLGNEVELNEEEIEKIDSRMAAIKEELFDAETVCNFDKIAKLNKEYNDLYNEKKSIQEKIDLACENRETLDSKSSGIIFGEDESDYFYASIEIGEIGRSLYGCIEIASNFRIYYVAHKPVMEITDYETGDRFFGELPNIANIRQYLMHDITRR